MTELESQKKESVLPLVDSMLSDVFSCKVYMGLLSL